MANFDGYPVDHYQGRFSGTFDVEPADGESLMRYGNKVMIVVVATVGTANLSEDKNGDMKRLNTLAVDTVQFVAPEAQSDLLAELGVAHQLGLLHHPKGSEESELVATPDGYVDEDGEVIEELDPPVTEAPAARLGLEDRATTTDVLPVRGDEVDGVVGRIPPPKDPRLARFLSEAAAR